MLCNSLKANVVHCCAYSPMTVSTTTVLRINQNACYAVQHRQRMQFASIGCSSPMRSAGLCNNFVRYANAAKWGKGNFTKFAYITRSLTSTRLALVETVLPIYSNGGAPES